MSRLRAFTLLEILIVITIIGIITTVAAVIFSHTTSHRQQKAIAQQLALRLNFAAKEAVLQPTTLGCQINKHSYKFYQAKAKKDSKSKWQLITNDRDLNPVTINKNIRLILLKPKTDRNQTKIDLLFLPAATNTPFKLLIKADTQNNYLIIGKNDGTITLKTTS